MAEWIENRDVTEAREAMAAQLAPNGEALTDLLIQLHQESAQHQRKARARLDRVWKALEARLDGQVVDAQGNKVEVTTRELANVAESLNNAIKVEAMAQRGYDVHLVAAGRGTGAGSMGVDEFLRQEALKELPE